MNCNFEIKQKQCNCITFAMQGRFYSKGKIYIEYINIFFVITNVITLKVETQKKYGYDKS